MDQQRNAIEKRIITMFPLSATGPVSVCWMLAIKWPIKWSIKWLTNRHSDIVSTQQHLAQNFIRLAHVALTRFCNLHTKVWNDGKSQLGLSQASRDKAVRSLCVHGAMTRCTFKH